MYQVKWLGKMVKELCTFWYLQVNINVQVGYLGMDIEATESTVQEWKIYKQKI